jgi:hypothetical protein
VAPTLDEKIALQKQQREFEQTRTRKRREMFDRQDQIDLERGKLIETLQAGMDQVVKVDSLFILQWQLD